MRPGTSALKTVYSAAKRSPGVMETKESAAAVIVEIELNGVHAFAAFEQDRYVDDAVRGAVGRFQHESKRSPPRRAPVRGNRTNTTASSDVRTRSVRFNPLHPFREKL
jgi:hypothetical protein